jgi:peptidoglycan/LPS O-acetylase OafA/YrhL
MAYRPDVDGLRAMAVLCVIGYHAFPENVLGGFIGVDVFFVISGFLISSIIFERLDNDRFSFLDFYAKRIQRIFPALIIVLASCLIGGWFSLLAIEYAELGKHVAAGAGFVSNVILLNEAGYFDTSAAVKPLLHLWSLGIEEQFYIVWPLLLFSCRRLRIPFVAVTGIALISSLVVAVQSHASNPIVAFYSPLARGWELMSGTILALAFMYWPASRNLAAERVERTGWQRNAGAVAGVTFIIGGSLFVTNESNFVLLYVLPVAGAFLLIAAGPRAWINRTLLSHPMMTWIGAMSYPLYLWHWPLLTFARILRGEPATGLTRITIVIATFVLAWATYRFIERPIRTGNFNKRKAAILSGVMIVVGCAGFGLAAANGLATRPFNVVNRGISEAMSYDWQTNFRAGTCFLSGAGDNPRFAQACTPRPNPGRPLVVIWGDSHAASLYQGFIANAARHNFDVAQYTASGCPPILDFIVRIRPACVEINRSAFRHIAERKPALVIMSAFWAMYDSHNSSHFEDLDASRLESTVRTLAKAGAGNVTLVGNLPAYDVVQAEMLKHEPFIQRVANRTYRNFRPSVRTYDALIAHIAETTGAHFIDPLRLLCNAEGCLISLSSTDPVPLSFDNGHFDTIGSDYFVSMLFADRLIDLRNR